MAIQMSFMSSTGATFESAYFKVSSYSCGDDNQINAKIRAYVSKETADAKMSAIEGSENLVSFTATYAEDSKNTKSQIYDYLKTMESYSSATDC